MVQRLQEENKQLGAGKQELSDMLYEERLEWDQQNTAHHQYIGVLERENKDLKARMAGDRDRMAELYREVEELKTRVETLLAQKTHFASELKTMQGELDEAQDELVESRRHVAKLVIDLAEAEKKLGPSSGSPGPGTIGSMLNSPRPRHDPPRPYDGDAVWEAIGKLQVETDKLKEAFR